MHHKNKLKGQQLSKKLLSFPVAYEYIQVVFLGPCLHEKKKKKKWRQEIHVLIFLGEETWPVFLLGRASFSLVTSVSKMPLSIPSRPASQHCYSQDFAIQRMNKRPYKIHHANGESSPRRRNERQHLCTNKSKTPLPKTLRCLSSL